MTVKPYAGPDPKKQQVEQMFDKISPRYDLLNRLFSLGIDQRWRRKIVRMMRSAPPDQLLDVATGTADLAIASAKVARQIIGIDISEGMLRSGRGKIEQKRLQERIELIKADSEALPFSDNRFDAVTVAFGVRNFGDLEKGISEMLRVLKPGGRLFVLEFSKPTRTPFKQLFHFYFHVMMPFFGRIISGDKAAYSYLPESVEAFPDGNAFLQILQAQGGQLGSMKPVTGGIATIYVVMK